MESGASGLRYGAVYQVTYFYRYFQAILDKAKRSSDKYLEARSILLPWLDQTEARLNEDFNLDDSEVDIIIEDLSSLSEEIAERRLLVDKLVQSGEKLGALGASELKDESSKINSRYQDLRENCREKKREMQQLQIEEQQFLERLNTLQRLDSNFSRVNFEKNSKIRIFNFWIKNFELNKSAISRLGERLNNTGTPEGTVDRIRTAIKENDAYSREFDRLTGMKNQLFSAKSAELAQNDKIATQIGKIESSWNQIDDTLKSRGNKLARAQDEVASFWSKEVTVSHSIDHLDEELRKLRPTHQNGDNLAKLGEKTNGIEMVLVDLRSEAVKLGDEVDNAEALKVRLRNMLSLRRFIPWVCQISHFLSHLSQMSHLK